MESLSTDFLPITGTTNDDIINGLGDDDIIRALEGADKLNGGPGQDTLEGGPGADIFILANLDLADLIADYNSAEGDLIDFTALFSVDGNGGDQNTDDLSDFVQLIDNGDGAVDQLQVDVTGGANNFTTVATLDGDAGVSVIFDDGGVDTTGII